MSKQFGSGFSKISIDGKLFQIQGFTNMNLRVNFNILCSKSAEIRIWQYVYECIDLLLNKY